MLKYVISLLVFIVVLGVLNLSNKNNKFDTYFPNLQSQIESTIDKDTIIINIKHVHMHFMVVPNVKIKNGLLTGLAYEDSSLSKIDTFYYLTPERLPTRQISKYVFEKVTSGKYK